MHDPTDGADDRRTPDADARLDRLLRDLAVANGLPPDAGPAPGADRPPPGAPRDGAPPPASPPRGYS